MLARRPNEASGEVSPVTFDMPPYSDQVITCAAEAGPANNSVATSASADSLRSDFIAFCLLVVTPSLLTARMAGAHGKLGRRTRGGQPKFMIGNLRETLN